MNYFNFIYVIYYYKLLFTLFIIIIILFTLFIIIKILTFAVVW